MVLYAPDMAANIFSARAVMSMGGSMSFGGGKCTVSERGQTVITAHPVPNGQHALDSIPTVGAVAAVAMGGRLETRSSGSGALATWGLATCAGSLRWWVE